MSDDKRSMPVFAVIAGLPGVGKSTLLDQLRDETGFPAHLVQDTPAQRQHASLAVCDALALRHSVAVESRCDSPTVLHWMQQAGERGFCVELVWIGVEGEVLAARRSRARCLAKTQVEATQRRLAIAADLAQRVLCIDNSTATARMAARVEHGRISVLDIRPGWIVRRMLIPRLARLASLRSIRRAYDAIVTHSPVQPLWQLATASGTYTGAVVAATEFHLLQQVGTALHVVHDLGMLAAIPGGLLAAPAVLTVAYDDAIPARAQQGIQQRGPER